MGDFVTQGASNETLTYGAVTATSKGTVVTASATANTKGAWAELDSAISDDAMGISVTMTHQANDVSPFVEHLVDIGIGGSGNEEVIIPNISFNITPNHDTERMSKYYFPIKIPAGTRVAARCQQGSTTQDVVLVSIEAGTPAFTNITLSDEIVAIGADTSASNGTPVDPGSTNNTKGAWTELVASSSVDVRSTMLVAGVNGNTSQRSQGILVDLGVGGSGNEEVIQSNMVGVVHNNEWVDLNYTFTSVSIPSGTRIAIRSQTTDASNVTDRVLDFILYGST